MLPSTKVSSDITVAHISKMQLFYRSNRGYEWSFKETLIYMHLISPEHTCGLILEHLHHLPYNFHLDNKFIKTAVDERHHADKEDIGGGAPPPATVLTLFECIIRANLEYFRPKWFIIKWAIPETYKMVDQ